MRRICGLAALLGLPVMVPGVYLWLGMDVPLGEMVAKAGLTVFALGVAGLIVTRKG